MRRLLCAVFAALAWTASAHAAAAPVPDARAYYVVNASNGEVIASHDAQLAVPIASMLCPPSKMPSIRVFSKARR